MLLSDVILISGVAYQHFAYARFPYFPHIANCAGTESAALLGCGLLSSYLVLFIKFYIETYKKPAGVKKLGNGHANGNGYVCLSNRIWLWLNALQGQAGVRGGDLPTAQITTLLSWCPGLL
jgi:hypothetical protein